jgi:hypothetical protein
MNKKPDHAKASHQDVEAADGNPDSSEIIELRHRD